MNAPDDWNAHHVRCDCCGGRYHASEWCESCHGPCEDCGEPLWDEPADELQVCPTCREERELDGEEELLGDGVKRLAGLWRAA